MQMQINTVYYTLNTISMKESENTQIILDTDDYKWEYWNKEAIM